MRGQFIANPEDSRYGGIQFILKTDSFLVVQEDGIETRDSRNPLMDVKSLFEKHIQHKEKKRVYCNSNLRDRVNPRFQFFGFFTSDEIYFHNSPSTMKTNGMVIRSGKSMELSFNTAHDLMKKDQVKRVHLVPLGDYESFASFRILETELVTWKNRNKQSILPAITIG